MTQQNVIFWDHSFHNKTKSTDFLFNLFSQHFKVTRVWDDNSALITNDINNLAPAAVIFIQTLPKLSEIKKIKCPNKFWVPMWDDFCLKPPGFEMFYTLGEGIKVISFCKQLSKKIKGEVHTFQYFPKPIEDIKNKAYSKKIFFWQRNDVINFELVKKLLGNFQTEGMLFKPNPDPGYFISEPTREEIKTFDIKTLEPWLSKEQYFKYLEQCSIFIAPRKREGIGSSFLEAMARGLCIISANEATANEYIEHNKTGLLYDLGNVKALDLANYKEIAQNAYDFAQLKHQAWLKSIPELMQLIYN